MNSTKTPPTPGHNRARRPGRWTAPALIAILWLAIVAGAVTRLRQADGVLLAMAAFGAAAFTFAILVWAEAHPMDRPDARAGGLPPIGAEGRADAILGRVSHRAGTSGRRGRALFEAARQAAAASSARTAIAEPDPQAPPPGTLLTRSGLFGAPSVGLGHRQDPQLSGNYSTTDMVNRLEPAGWRWLESSPAEQEFLGWTLPDLRARSFLDVVHPDDRDLARETFLQALERGEALGLVIRIRTARARPASSRSTPEPATAPTIASCISAATSPTSPRRSAPSAPCGSAPAS